MTIREWARRHALERDVDVLGALRTSSDAEIARASGLPPHWVDGVRSYYELLHEPRGPMVCDGTSCHFAGAVVPDGTCGSTSTSASCAACACALAPTCKGNSSTASSDAGTARG
jgi:hypothetical protein